MDYSTLIKDAWRTTWRFRFLWLLGVFAGGTAGVSRGGGPFRWQARRGDVGHLLPDLQGAAAQAPHWLANHGGLVIAGVATLAILGLAALVASLVAQGGMAQATADLATGRTSSLGRAWRAGLRLFWRYVGLWVALAGLAIVTAAVAGGFAAAVVGVVSLADALAARAIVVVVALLAGLPLVAGIVALGIAMSIVVPFAQRAIAVENVGPVAALRAGWRLFRSHVGESLLVWLIALALAVGSGVVIAVGMVAVIAALGGVGALVWAVAGFSAPTIAYAALGLAVVFATGLLVAGVANTFFWNYWTLAYLRLAGQRGALA